MAAGGEDGAARAPTRAITRFLVPLDGTAGAAAALGPALRAARVLRVPLELLTVHDRVNRTWAEDVDAIAAGLDYDRVEVSMVGSGWPGDVIVDAVAEQPGTVVCMATHNRDRFSRLVAGSVTEHVLRQAAAPVLMIGPGYLRDEGGGAGGRALVCLDGGSRDTATLALGRGWARQLGLEVELVHVASPGGAAVAETRLSGAARRLEADGLAVRTTVLTGADPAGDITGLLHRRPGALAVLASRARVGIPKLVLGSVSSRILAASPRPLLLTRSS
ncbi:universal stress protein [Nocardiopsis alborubida]|uniref:Universal stress protein n=1 Tax=Nocardiopsis alborubida TaxID=146802 RepID=A0A7X6MHP7_9ACTN|nr:universal stress protein [Nocardiopsis alborubida]NKZ00938.1 universal stress protein [Nocardiopsis alborubida]